jgi:plastocyanin
MGLATRREPLSMAKRLTLLIALALLAAAGASTDSARSAAAASKTVKITKSGYNPTAVSVIVGDSVVFENDDTVAHSVDFKPTTGINCHAAIPVAVAAGQSATCDFSTAGSFKFSDPAHKGKSFRGTVTVAAPPDVTITATPKSVGYRKTVTLSGKLASQLSGQSLQVMAQACGTSSPVKLANVTTTTGGAFTTQTQPLKQTAYTVKSKNSTSLAATVGVKPLLKLRKVARHRYTLTISAAQSFAGKYANFQRWNAKLKHWRGVRRVLLQANAAGVAPTVFTTAKFRSSIKARLRVRVILKQSQVGACYLPGKSNTIRS